MIVNKKGFTLVELIVTVTILAVLATVWFISYAWYAAQARDSTRLAGISMMQKAIEINSMKSSQAAMPDDVVEIKIGSNLVWYQWEAGQWVMNQINFSNGWVDPKYGDYYTYFLSANQANSQILTYLETNTYANENIANLSNQSFANYDYFKRFPYYKWSGLGLIIDEDKQPINKLESVISEWEFDMFTVENAPKEITALFNNKQNFQNKSLFIGGQIESRNRKNKKLSPEQCPENFILVPWNLALWQTDFCIGKYEASQNGSSKNNPFLTQSWNNPVTSIGVNGQTYELCEWNGKWYHTMTFNEWRTIARNIELQPENWSEWIVWEGFIKSWNNGSTITWFNAWWIIAWWVTSNPQQDQLRQLQLSNGEIIWDFIWNVREITQHMNLTNMNGNNLNPFYTYDHTKYQTVYDNIFIEGLNKWDKVSWWNITDINYKNNYGPKITNNIQQWVWMLFNPPEVHSIDIRYFLTWWDYSTSLEYENGLYSILHYDDTSWSNIWIRCAYIPN